MNFLTVGSDYLLFVVRAGDYIGIIGWFSVKVAGNSFQHSPRL